MVDKELSHYPKIYIFGDSHTRSFSGRQNIVPYFVGPGLYHNLVTDGLDVIKFKLSLQLKRLEIKENLFFFYFGEPDCRRQLGHGWFPHEKAEKIEPIVNEKELVACVDNYLNLIKELEEEFLFKANFIAPTTAFQPAIPAVRFFSDYLKNQRAEDVIDLNPLVLDENGVVPKHFRNDDFSYDPLHLNQNISSVFLRLLAEKGVLEGTDNYEDLDHIDSKFGSISLDFIGLDGSGPAFDPYPALLEEKVLTVLELDKSLGKANEVFIYGSGDFQVKLCAALNFLDPRRRFTLLCESELVIHSIDSLRRIDKKELSSLHGKDIIIADLENYERDFKDILKSDNRPLLICPRYGEDTNSSRFLGLNGKEPKENLYPLMPEEKVFSMLELIEMNLNQKFIHIYGAGSFCLKICRAIKSQISDIEFRIYDQSKKDFNFDGQKIKVKSVSELHNIKSQDIIIASSVAYFEIARFIKETGNHPLLTGYEYS